MQHYWVLQTPQYSWNTAKVGVKHQSINQSINRFKVSIANGISLWMEI